MKVKVWAILGDAHAGKSTTIAHLVHQKRGAGGWRYVLLRGGGYLRIHALRRAWQEASLQPQQGIMKFSKIGAVRPTVNCLNLLIALRYSPTGGYPSAEAYLTAFSAHNWEIASLVLLNYSAAREHYFNFGAPTLDLRDTTELARVPSRHGELVGKVRNHFEWA
jgi:hypothetical protein